MNGIYRTREHPMHNAERVPATVWAGMHIAEGDRIAYDVTVYGRDGTEGTARHEGVIVELWLDHWWGSPDPQPYAEVDEDDGDEERVWFRRDRASTEMPLLTGPTVEGGLF